MAPDLETVWYSAEWAVRIGALGIVPLRRSPAAARTWLLLIFFLPIPGLLLFLAIGNPRFPPWRTRRFKDLRPFFEVAAAQLSPFAADLGDKAAIADLARTLGQMPVTGGNAVELIDDYDGVIDRLVSDIDAAQRSVHLLVYIFADDRVGHRVADALARAVERGLEARVMIDPVGSRPWRRAILERLRTSGVVVAEALPFHVLSHRTRRDMRNHRKLFVIDGRIGYAGSQNIVAKDFRPGIVNRELVARVEGPIVASIEAVVRADWSLETGDAPRQPEAIAQAAGSAQAQLLPSSADHQLEGFETLLVWQLHQARERAIIVTPYFIPDEDVLGAMRSAVARGVCVDLVVSKVVDQRIVNWSQSSYYDDLLVAGVRIHQFRDFLLHAKNVSIDGSLAIVGSSNVDLRSFQLNEEASLLLYDDGSVAAVEAIQHGYLDNSDRLDLETWRSRPMVRKLAENVARLLNSLL